MKKTAFLLALLMLLSSFVSCGETTTEPDKESDVPVQETEPAEEPDLYDVGWENLPDTKYDGRTFNVLTRDDLGGTGDSGVYEIVADEEKLAEQTNEAVYNRNMLIEQEFGVKITAEGPGNWDAVTTHLENSVLAQDHNYTLVSPVEFKVYALVTKGLVGNWLDVPVVNLDAPWWNARSNKQSTINGKLFAACSDLSVTSVMNSYGIFFNADLADQHGIATETLQNAVFDGKWTIDYLTSLVANLYVDNNGDGVKDDMDTYGFVSPTVNPTDAWPTPADASCEYQL